MTKESFDEMMRVLDEVGMMDSANVSFSFSSSDVTYSPVEPPEIAPSSPCSDLKAAECTSSDDLSGEAGACVLQMRSINSSGGGDVMHGQGEAPSEGEQRGCIPLLP